MRKQFLFLIILPITTFFHSDLSSLNEIPMNIVLRETTFQHPSGYLRQRIRGGRYRRLRNGVTVLCWSREEMAQIMAKKRILEQRGRGRKRKFPFNGQQR